MMTHPAGTHRSGPSRKRRLWLVVVLLLLPALLLGAAATTVYTVLEGHPPGFAPDPYVELRLPATDGDTPIVIRSEEVHCRLAQDEFLWDRNDIQAPAPDRLPSERNTPPAPFELFLKGNSSSLISAKTELSARFDLPDSNGTPTSFRLLVDGTKGFGPNSGLRDATYFDQLTLERDGSGVARGRYLLGPDPGRSLDSPFSADHEFTRPNVYIAPQSRDVPPRGELTLLWQCP